MRMFSLKALLGGILISQTAVFVIGQATFAKGNEKTGTVYEQSGVGLGRTFKPGRLSTVTEAEESVLAPVPVVTVYAAYTSYTANNANNTYWAWTRSNCAYMFVAFRVSQKTKVKVSWDATGTSTTVSESVIFTDSLEPGGLLNPRYWYYAWLNPDPLAKGLYEYKATVQPVDAGGNLIGSPADDKCKFEVR